MSPDRLEGFAGILGTWDHSDLPNNVRVGADCFLERRDSFARFRSEREPGLVLGDRVQVYTWTTFNIEPSGCVTVGNDSILVGAVFMCAGDICVGERVVISYHVTIADSDFHPRDPELRIQDAIANAPFGDRAERPPIEVRGVSIGDDVHVGIGAIILKGVQVGAGAQIGAGAVVTSDIPAGAVVVGNPGEMVAPTDD